MSNQEDTLDNQYFEWLYKELGVVGNRNPTRSYWSLARLLYTTPFTWAVPNDDNREGDGFELREEFMTEKNPVVDDRTFKEWDDLECSMLEMLLALARRASFESLIEPYEWFWMFMENLGLHHWNDAQFGDQAKADISEALDRVNFRTYQKNGVGGLFPLRDAKEDQTKVELWYQMAEYLRELDHLSSRRR